MPSRWQDKPWYPGQPTGIVLYETPDGWRFALVTPKGGFVDGALGRPGLATEAAQAEMLRRLRENDDVELAGSWTTTKPGWWSADLKPIQHS